MLKNQLNEPQQTNPDCLAGVKNVAVGGAAPPGQSLAHAHPGTVSSPSDAAHGNIESKILLAGDDLPLYQSIQRELVQLQPNWFCQSVAKESQALEKLGETFFDAVVSERKLVEGTGFLETVSVKFPRTVRVVLGEPVLPAESRQAGRAGTEFLRREADPKTLAENIARILCVQQWLADPSMRKLLSSIHRLPTLPQLHAQIIEKLRDPEGALEEVSHLIGQDPVMAAKFLQIVNSACFALAYTIADASEAVMFLGAARTRSLVLMANVFSQFDRVRCTGFSLDQLWNHSLRVGSLARGITLLESPDPKLTELAFTAGLLHEIGNLILAENMPEMYSTVRKLQVNKQLTLPEAELEILGTTSARLGACLLGTWQLPLVILEAVALHGFPSGSKDTQFSVTTAVHVANVLAQETLRGTGIIDQPESFSLDYLARLGLAQRRNYWRECCGLPVGIERDASSERIRKQRDAKNN